jgi:hypothetical protein
VLGSASAYNVCGGVRSTSTVRVTIPSRHKRFSVRDIDVVFGTPVAATSCANLIGPFCKCAPTLGARRGAGGASFIFPSFALNFFHSKRGMLFGVIAAGATQMSIRS